MQQALLLQPDQPFDIGPGIRAPRFPRGKALGPVEGIQIFDRAVDPAKAEGLFHRVVVGEPRFAGGFHGKDEPDLLLRLKVPGKPVPPPLPVS